MNFHGHDINFENAYHSVSLEYAKGELRSSENEAMKSGKALTPQGKLDILYTEYLTAYGYLCNKPEGLARSLLEHNYLDS